MSKPADQTVLGKLRDYHARHGDIPSLDALRLLLNASPESLLVSLTRLASAGFLSKTGPNRFAPSTSFFTQPMAEEAVPAGAPAALSARLSSHDMNLQSWLVRKPSQSVLVTVSGDSMIGAGIFDGDVVVVETAAQARPGDIVIASVDGQQTVKRLAKDKIGFFLKPENAKHRPIRPRGELEIQGVVVGLARQLH